MCACEGLRRSERVSDHLELKFQAPLSLHVSAGGLTGEQQTLSPAEPSLQPYTVIVVYTKPNSQVQ